MSHSFACQKISCHPGGRPASTPWTYVSAPSSTAGTTHATEMSSQSRPIFTPGTYQRARLSSEDEQGTAWCAQPAVGVREIRGQSRVEAFCRTRSTALDFRPHFRTWGQNNCSDPIYSGYGVRTIVLTPFIVLERAGEIDRSSDHGRIAKDTHVAQRRRRNESAASPSIPHSLRELERN